MGMCEAKGIDDVLELMLRTVRISVPTVADLTPIKLSDLPVTLAILRVQRNHEVLLLPLSTGAQATPLGEKVVPIFRVTDGHRVESSRAEYSPVSIPPEGVCPALSSSTGPPGINAMTRLER